MKTIVPSESLEEKIFLIRGKKVMFDQDLAELYGVKTKALNQAVTRNRERFPIDFMFQLTWEESKILRSQSVTLSWGEHSKYRPFAFTEQGVAMLSSVLRSKRAVRVNIAIMRAFVKLRELLSVHKELAYQLKELEQTVTVHDEKIERIFRIIEKLMVPTPQSRKGHIGFRP